MDERDREQGHGGVSDGNGIINPAEALQNVLLQLQQDPARYRLFGIYWWPIKALLKGVGYGRDQLYMLGDYQDPETATLIPPIGLQATLVAAFTEFGQNARYPRPDGRVEDPDGELVTVMDEDAGL